MRVDIPVGLVLLAEVAQELQHDGVFQNVGVIACMKGVAVAEHDEETLKEGVPLQGGFGDAAAMWLHNADI
jgi:hypothetical protein